MRVARILAALGWIASITANAADVLSIPCDGTDKACALEMLQKHPVKNAESWRSAFALPVEQRFGPAPPPLVQFLALDNIFHGFREQPRSARPAPEFMADVRAAIDELPPPVKRILGQELAGIYFVESLGGTGFTDVIRDDRGPAGAFVVFDADVLDKRVANDWATWKENTPFKAGGKHFLVARIEPPATNTRKYAIQYILLHELGHVLSVHAKVHPDWNLRPKEVPASMEFPYFRLSWRIDRARDRYESIFDNGFPERSNVAYYVGPKLEAKDMAPVYSRLEKTNFPTLYAATLPGDDFAEAFANYVHVVLMKKPFAIEIREGDRIVKSYGSCWNDSRCAEKRRIIEALLAR